MSALSGLTIAVSGTHKGYTQVKIEALVADNGGTFSKAKVVDSDTTHLISNEADVKKSSAKVKSAQEAVVHIVSLDWLLKSIEEGKKQDEAEYSLAAPAPAAPSSRPKRKAAEAAAASKDEDEEEEEARPAKKAKTAPSSKTAPTSKTAPVSKTAPASKGKAKGKGKSKAKVKDEDEVMDDVQEEKEEEKEEEAPEPAPNMKKIVKKGKAPVDELCGLAGSHHVYVDGSGVAWDATLNQTDIGRNNNKFYYCQLLERDSAPYTYAVFCRWGRVGDRGQTKMYEQGVSLPVAMATFDKQMKAKTGKNWVDRAQATGGNKKYAYLERNYDEDEDEDEAANVKASGSGKAEESKPVPKPTIATELVKLMELIFNTSFMQQAMAEMSYDANKLPLGKLSKDTILRGFNVLKQIGEVIGDPATAVQKYGQHGGSQGDILRTLSNQYYTVIPHNFGRNVPPAINTAVLLKREADLVENLIDMKISTEIISASNKNHDVHPVDQQYRSLNLEEATPLDKQSSEFKYLEGYVKKTHGHTHHSTLKVEEIFRIKRTDEETRWSANGWDSYAKDNRKLLWHGSRTTNFSGILSQGLRIAPPEAPVNGYMFDKGIYLADIVSKSANYCCPYLSDNTALLLLCEAQLGDPMYESVNADYYAATNSKKQGAIATKGLGRTAPMEWEDAKVINEELNGVQLPKVSGNETSITGDVKDKDRNLYLQYNEYIVYDVSQVKLRYLFRVKMT